MDISHIDVSHVQTVRVFDWYQAWVLETMASRSAARRRRAVELLSALCTRWKIRHTSGTALQAAEQWAAVTRHNAEVRRSVITRWVHDARARTAAREARLAAAVAEQVMAELRLVVLRRWVRRHRERRKTAQAALVDAAVRQFGYVLRLKAVRERCLRAWCMRSHSASGPLDGAGGPGRPLVEVANTVTQTYGVTSYVETELMGGMPWTLSVEAPPGDYLLLAQCFGRKIREWTVIESWARADQEAAVDEWAVIHPVTKVAASEDMWVG